MFSGLEAPIVGLTGPPQDPGAPAPAPAGTLTASLIAGVLRSSALMLFLSLAAHCSGPQAKGLCPGGTDASRADLWASANRSQLQGFWCQPASQLPRDQLSALIRRLASLQVPLQAWQLGCLANLASRCGLQDDFMLHPPSLLLFYNLSQLRADDCRAFIRRATQGDLELLDHLPDQRVALRRAALACLAGPLPRLRASDLQLLGVLVCDMDASSIATADPHVLENLQCCPQLTADQRTALNSLLAGGRTQLGPPGSWTVEKLQALGPLATYISPHLWAQVQEAVGLGFFHSVVAACRTGRLSRHEARRFVSSFLESKAKPVSSGHRLRTGRACVRGHITAATLQDDLFLVHYDCGQLESCLDSRVLTANLDPLLQHPLPAECQRVVKAKLTQIYPGGLPEAQLRLITSLVYLYSGAEIGQWNITSRDTVVALLASDVALENQTSAVLQKFLDHNGTVSSALLLAIGGARLCWMSPQQIQTIPPQELRLAGALDVSSCPQSRKDVLYTKAQEAFGSSRTPAAYYRLMRPYLGEPWWWAGTPPKSPAPAHPRPVGGAPAEELRQLAQANISMDIDTFTGLNPRVLQSLDVSTVIALLGPNVGDLQKARSHPAVRSWLRSLSSSALGQLGLDTEHAGPTGSAHATSGLPSTTPQAPHLAHTSGLPGNAAQASTSGSLWTPLGYLPLAVALPSSLLWLLHWGTSGPAPHCSPGPCTLGSVDVTASGWLGSQGSGAGKTGLLGAAGCPLGMRGRL
ncbi:mesothelin-like protein isoform X4 [Cebus imitator]|uniref:mesothelin-like protein isoform X4 n=1 Tax=Cebus imitator TaxID=2715852 RepID=UPI00080A6BE0|nr:mesothelin-like protein isoform X4 [Cebus imitator]